MNPTFGITGSAAKYVRETVESRNKHKTFQQSLHKLQETHRIMRSTLKPTSTVFNDVKTQDALKSSSGNSSERSTSPQLDFTLYGSAAPVCFQKTKLMPFNKKVHQPPNSPSQYKTRKVLPVEKIVLLSDQLRSRKLNLQFTDRQDSDDMSLDLRTPSSRPSYSDRIDDGAKSPGRDYSLDLTSVADTEESSSSSADEISTYGKPCIKLAKRITPASESSSAWSRSPVNCIWKDNRSMESRNSDDTSDARSYVWTVSTRRSSETSQCSELKELSCRSEQPAMCTAKSGSSQPRSRSADLIYVYVKTVNKEGELERYFRPCSACNERCCVCPDDQTLEEPKVALVEEPDCLLENHWDDLENEKQSKNSHRDFKELNVTYRSEEAKSANIQSSSRCSHCCSLDDRSSPTFSHPKSPSPCEENRVVTGDAKISLPLIQLATAAHCARVLADNLEAVLETVDKNLLEQVREEKCDSPKSVQKYVNNYQCPESFRTCEELDNLFQDKLNIYQKSVDVNTCDRNYSSYINDRLKTNRSQFSEICSCKSRYSNAELIPEICLPVSPLKTFRLDDFPEPNCDTDRLLEYSYSAQKQAEQLQLMEKCSLLESAVENRMQFHEAEVRDCHLPTYRLIYEATETVSARVYREVLPCNRADFLSERGSCERDRCDSGPSQVIYCEDSFCVEDKYVTAFSSSDINEVLHAHSDYFSNSSSTYSNPS